MNMLTRRSLIAVTAMAATTGLAACGSSSSGSASPTRAAAMATTANTAVTPADPAVAGLVGPDCASYASQVPSGAGSVDGMTQDPVATAASHNPLLKELTAAVSGKLNTRVNLVSTLNGGSGWTVFAPIDSAFAKLPAASVKELAMPKNAKLLTSILTYHVIAGQLKPGQVVGTQKSVEGGNLVVTRSGNALKVNGANVICGGVKTANAIVYLIDGVLTPPKK